MADAPKTPKLLKAYQMPVDKTVFSGVPSVTALKPLPKANVFLAAAMDRRVVCCDLAAEPPPVPEADKEKNKGAIPPIVGKHLLWAHDHWIHDLDVHPDGERVATGGADRFIRLWKWGEERPLSVWKAHDDWVRVVAFSPDGRILASAGDDKVAKLWDATSGQHLATLDAKSSYLDTLAWSKAGDWLLASGNNGRVYVWNVAERKLVRDSDIDNRRDIEEEPLNGGFSYPGGVRGMTASPDGKRLAAVGLESLNVLEMADGKEVLKQDGRAFGVAYDPTGRWLAWSQEKDILIWDFETGAVSHKITVDQLGLFDMFFLEEGRRLASGGCNGRVGIWDLTA
jgi:WD40 repeat protein